MSGTKAPRQRQPEVAEFVRPRWAAWLSLALSRSGSNQAQLAKNLAKDPNEDDNAPRSLLNRWLAAEITVSAKAAFRAGVALHNLGHPYASGFVALFAAGRFGDAIGLARRIVLDEPDPIVFSHVHNLLLGTMTTVEADIAEAQGWMHLFRPDRVEQGSLSQSPANNPDYARQSLRWEMYGKHHPELPDYPALHERAWRRHCEGIERASVAERSRIMPFADAARQMANMPNVPPARLHLNIVQLLKEWLRELSSQDARERGHAEMVEPSGRSAKDFPQFDALEQFIFLSQTREAVAARRAFLDNRKGPK